MKSLAFVERLAFVKCYSLIDILCPIDRADIMFLPKSASRGASRGLSTATLIYAPLIDVKCAFHTVNLWHGNAYRAFVRGITTPLKSNVWGSVVFSVINLDMLLKKQSTYWWFGRPECTCDVPVITFIHKISKLSEYRIKSHHIPSDDHNQMIMTFAMTFVVVAARSSLSPSSSISLLAGDVF